MFLIAWCYHDTMDYQDNEFGLRQLLGELERIQGTFPPVYRSRGLLIGYDKRGRITVLAASKDEPMPGTWLNRALKALGRQMALPVRR
jgi:hypothetical protein